MVPRLLKHGVAAGAVIIGAEAAYAVLRPTPRFAEFDPSGSFGEPHHPPIRVAVLGDSSVTAPGVAGPEEIWVTRVCRRLAETRHVTLQSYAVGGSKAADLIENQLDHTLAFSPDLVLVAVGANDVIRGVSLRAFEGQLHTGDNQVRRGRTDVDADAGELEVFFLLHVAVGIGKRASRGGCHENPSEPGFER